VDDANRRIVQFLEPGSSLDGKPGFAGVFGSQFANRRAEERPSGTLFATSKKVSLMEIGASFARYRPRPTRSILPALARFQRCERDTERPLSSFELTGSGQTEALVLPQLHRLGA
jgi:hypothetical protein